MTAVAGIEPSRPAYAWRAVRLHWRSSLALAVVSAFGVAAFGWPLLLHHAAGADGHETDAPFVVAGLLALLLATLLAEVADGGVDAKALAMLGVLAAVGAVLRVLDPGVSFSEGLVFFLLVPAGRVLGRGFGFLLGALTLFSSALITVGVGPWLPFQMLAAGWFGFGAGCLPRALRGRAEMALLAAYGVLGSLAYGLVMDLSFWPFKVGSAPGPLDYVPAGSVGENLRHFWAFHVATSLGWDTLRGAGTAALLLALGRPVLAALRRAARRAAFVGA
jgi:energy-coupling factor transport system substrate-specific component